MAKKKRLTYEQKLINALRKIPVPLFDRRHNLNIYFDDNRARSNESRFQHIVNQRHGLVPADIDRIPRYIKTCIFKKDSERTGTCNIYIKRNTVSDEYIKISLKIERNLLNFSQN